MLGDQVSANQHDPLLKRITANHVGPLSNERQLFRIRNGLGRGREIQPDEAHFGNLLQVAPDDWNYDDKEKQERVRRTILRQMWGENTGYPAEFYATKDTFREDAGHCFERHNRPGDSNGPYACIDYQSDQKRLTDQGWMRRGVDSGQPNRRHVYLCTFCPYESVVTVRKRSVRGDYDS